MARGDEVKLADLRLYRAAFLPAVVAFVAMMFSLEGMPAGLEPIAPTGAYEGERATSIAREIVRIAPERQAGSEGDEAAADLVRQNFDQIPAGSVSEQEFSAEVDGDDVDLTNVLVTLPGSADRTIAIVASRDSPQGPGAVTSAAATGVLVELAQTLGVSGHDATYVLASTTGGEAGVRAFIEELPSRDTIDPLIIVSQPGAAEPSPPYALITSTGTRKGSVGLRSSAEAAIESQTDLTGDGESGFRQLARLAFPSGLGEQAPLVADGIPAVRISSAGERRVAPEDDEPDDLSADSIDGFGRSIHGLVGALDAGRPLDPSPDTYIEVSGNLVPAWTITLLALALLLPALVAAVDAAARVMRRNGELVRALGWAAVRALPFVGALATLYALAAVGIVPRPEFPFDPGKYELGARAVISFVLMLAVGAVSAVLLRLRKTTGTRAPAGTAAGIGLVSVAALLVLWIVNPYAALLAVPAAHVWVLADGTPSRLRTGLTFAAAALAVVPTVAALGSVTGVLEVGSDAPWTLTLLVADGQIGFFDVLAGCFLAGSLLGACALALGGGGQLPAPFTRAAAREPDLEAEPEDSDMR